MGISKLQGRPGVFISKLQGSSGGISKLQGRPGGFRSCRGVHYFVIVCAAEMVRSSSSFGRSQRVLTS